MDIFDSYSSRSGEIFLAEIYKYSKQINSQKTSQSILFLYWCNGSGEYDACGVTLSVYPHRASLKNMP